MRLLVAFLLISSSVFSVDYTIISPKGGESITACSPTEVKFYNPFTSTSYVTFDYSLDNGASWINEQTSVSAPSKDTTSITWIPPAVVSSTCLVRIHRTGYFMDESVTAFSITPFNKITNITRPNGGEQFGTKDIEVVSWTSTSSASTVKLSYSTDGSTWAGGTIIPNTGSYNWEVPTAVSGTVKIKLTDGGTDCSYDESDNDFEIVGSPYIVASNITFAYSGYSGRSVHWTADHLGTGMVKIELSTDSGATWSTVVASTPYNQNYIWSIPNDTSSTNCILRYSDSSNPLIHDETDLFEIKQSKVSFTNLTNSDTAVWCNEETIDFKAENSSGYTRSYNIFSSINGGSTWDTIISGYRPFFNCASCQSASYNWAVPKMESSNYLLKVEDSVHTDVNAILVSPITLTTVGAKFITLDNFNGGETVETGQQVSVKINSNSTDRRYFYLSTDGGSTWTPNGSTYGDSLLWFVPNVVSDSCLIAVNNGGTCQGDTSNSFFSVKYVESIFVNRYNSVPNPSYYGYAAATVSWYSTNLSSGVVDIAFSSDSGSTWMTIASNQPDNGSYVYYHPFVESSNCFIKVSDATNPLVFDVNNYRFQVKKPTISIDSSAFSNAMLGCEQVVVDFNAEGTNVSKAYYSVDNRVSWHVADGTMYSSSFYWTPPNVDVNSIVLKLVNTDSSLVAYSPTVSLSKPLALISPNGGESLDIRTPYNITWSSASGFSASAITIKSSRDNGLSWGTIVSSAANTGSYEWTTGISVAMNSLISISDASTGCATDTSDNSFSVYYVPSIKLNAHDSVFYSDLPEYVNASTKNTVSDDYKLELSLDSGATWTVVESRITYPTIYKWTAPNTPSDKCLFRVSEFGNPSVYDISPKTFEIRQSRYECTSMANLEVVQACKFKEIQWVAHGYGSFASLYYSLDNGSSWTKGTRKYGCLTLSSGLNWDVPEVTATNCKIKIVDDTDTSHYTVLDSAFSIDVSYSSLSLAAPVGGETWTSGDYVDITWTGDYASSEVMILVKSTSSSAGSSYRITNDGSHKILIDPVAIPTPCKVIIEDMETCSADSSGTLYRDTDPFINPLYPAGGEVFFAESPIFIQWFSGNIKGGYGDIDVWFSSDNGNTWTGVGSYKTLSYQWTLPDVSSDSCLFKFFTSGPDPTGSPLTVHSNLFSIMKPSITVVAPVGGETLKGCTSTNITWTENKPAGESSNLNFYVSLNQGATWNPIETNRHYGSNYSKSYLWDVIGWSSADCLIKIEDNEDPSIFGISPAPFTIDSKDGANITLTSHQYPTSLNTFESDTIQWTSTNNVTRVNITRSIDGGVTWKNIVNWYPSTGKYIWTTPSDASSNYLIKLEDYDGCASATSAAFNVVGVKRMTVDNSLSGTVFSDTDPIPLYYSAYHTVSDSVLFEYSVDGGASWLVADRYERSSSSTNGYFYWVPNSYGVLSEYWCMLRVSDPVDPSTFAVSDTFSVQPAHYSVDFPYSGYVHSACSQMNIQWSKVGNYYSGDTIEFSPDGGANWQEIWSDLESQNENSAVWNVPEISSTQCKIRVTGWNGIYDETGLFTINNQNATIQITSPSTALTVNAGDDVPISWTYSSSVNTVSIYYSSDWENTTKHPIATHVTNTGSYTWTIDSLFNWSSVYIFVSDDDGCGEGVSDSAVTITAVRVLTLNSLQGGEHLGAGKKYYIDWDRAQLMSNVNAVDLSYSIDNGSTWKHIEKGVQKSMFGSLYEWIAPNENSSNCLFRVADSGDSTFFDVSSATFTIDAVGTLPVISPVLNDILIGGSTHQILWDKDQFEGSVEISYSLDDGLNWIVIKTNENVDTSMYRAYNDGVFAWTVPITISSTALVRVSSNLSSVVVHSSNRFAITKPVSVIKIEAGEELLVYPNPTTGILHVQLSEGVGEKQVLIHDFLGREVLRDLVVADVELFEYDLSNFKPGLYVLEVSHVKGSSTVKVVIER